MPIIVSDRALGVLRRALDAARLDPRTVGVRVSLARGPRGEELRTSFAEQPEPGEQTIEAGGITLFMPVDLAARQATLDVSEEHDRIVLR